ncbi:hypothetical protein ABPG75_004333 [Micractinium tetrahymenae]
MASLSALLVLLAALACSGTAVQAAVQQQRAGRRLLAVRDDYDGGRVAAGSLLRAGLSLQEAADARVCAMQASQGQCLQHECVGWTKVYMGLEGAAQQPGAVPAAAAECLAACGMPEHEAGCLAQTLHRLLNTSPLQFSCSSACIAGLLHSSCSQCSGGSGASGCHALHLGASTAAAECLVDAAV